MPRSVITAPSGIPITDFHYKSMDIARFSTLDRGLILLWLNPKSSPPHIKDSITIIFIVEYKEMDHVLMKTVFLTSRSSLNIIPRWMASPYKVHSIGITINDQSLTTGYLSEISNIF